MAPGMATPARPYLHLPWEHQFWLIHYEFILHKENWAELWPLYLSYNTEVRKCTTFDSLDPSQFHIGIWNDLEVWHISNKVLQSVKKDMNLRVYQSSSSNSKSHNNYPRTSFHNPSSFINNFCHWHNHSKGGKCIFCGDCSGAHLSRDCTASTCINRSPCFVQRHPPNNSRCNKKGHFFCFAWNGPNNCTNEKPCSKGERLCTLCGSPSHNAQSCLSIWFTTHHNSSCYIQVEVYPITY